MVQRRLLGSMVVIAWTLAVSGCAVWGMEGGPGGLGAAVPQGSASAPPVVVDAVRGTDGVQRVEVSVGDDLRFTPAVVRARVGVVELTFRNAGSTPHDARLTVGLDQAGQTGNLNAGQTATVRVRVDRPGSYPFPCVYHVSSGMQGTLEIS
ncbi:MAG TPA: cupredoxin domain-containing protein [Micromonosporaceae bacterium]